MEDDDSVEFMGLNPAGPSSPRRKSHRRRRLPPPTRRTAASVAAQDVIEIQDSDEDQGAGPVRTGKGKGKAVQAWRDNVEASGGPRKMPLFLPEVDSDSDQDVQAMLGAGDTLPSLGGRPHVQPAPKDKGKRAQRASVASRLSPREEYRISPASLPPASADASFASIMPPSPAPTTRIAAQVMEILPDVERGYLNRLIAHQISIYNVDGEGPEPDSIDDERIAQTVMHVLFEDLNYPKAPAAVPLPENARPSAAGPSDGTPQGISSRKNILQAEPLDEVMNRSIQSELAVSKILEVEPNNQNEGSSARPDALAASSSATRAPPPTPKRELDPESRTLAQVLEIIPDAEPTHVTKLIKQQLDAVRVDEADGQPARADPYERALQGVLHILFENPDYPKATKKRKRAAEDEGEDSGPSKTRHGEEVDYANKDRVKRNGRYYDEVSLSQLSNDFPTIPYQDVFTQFVQHNRLYAPTFLTLRAENRRGGALGPIPSQAVPRNRKKGKGKGKAAQRSDAEFEKERAWLIRKLQEEVVTGTDTAVEEEGEGFECGCCFSSYPFSKMTQCPDAHLFCVDCVTHYASTLLGEHNPAVACMDQSGCKLLFSPSELRRILSPKLLTLYERVSQRKELEAAGLENLEECPFCEYQVVIENEQEKLFRCEREDCGAVSCRKCKKLDHLPKSCEEANEDKKLDARHAVEEAMTAALMRNCPKCSKAFIKESGCNKMVCPNCHTMSCYVCRKIIHGYEHFNQAPPYNTAKDPKKCQLWDSVEQRHADEVAAAAKRAQEEVKRANPEVDEADLKVALPDAPPKPAVCNNPNHRHHYPHGGFAFGALPPMPPMPPPLAAQERLRGLQQGLQHMVARAHDGPFVHIPRIPPNPRPEDFLRPMIIPRGYVPPQPPPPPPPPPQHQYQTRARGPPPPAAGPARVQPNPGRMPAPVPQPQPQPPPPARRVRARR